MKRLWVLPVQSGLWHSLLSAQWPRHSDPPWAAAEHCLVLCWVPLAQVTEQSLQELHSCHCPSTEAPTATQQAWKKMADRKERWALLAISCFPFLSRAVLYWLWHLSKVNMYRKERKKLHIIIYLHTKVSWTEPVCERSHKHTTTPKFTVSERCLKHHHGNWWGTELSERVNVCVSVYVWDTWRQETDNTWAQGYVAKLSLGLGSVTGPASVLGRGTHPSPSAVTSATREGAQAPRRPLLPHTVYCGHREGVRPDRCPSLPHH